MKDVNLTIKFINGTVLGHDVFRCEINGEPWRERADFLRKAPAHNLRQAYKHVSATQEYLDEKVGGGGVGWGLAAGTVIPVCVIIISITYSELSIEDKIDMYKIIYNNIKVISRRTSGM